MDNDYFQPIDHLFSINNDDIIKEIKTLLSSSNNRFFAFVFLKKLIPEIRDDLFISNVSFWLQNLIKTLQDDRNQNERILCFNVLNQILVKIYEINTQNLTRELSISIAPVLIKCFTEFRLVELPYAINCLSVCATLFPALVSNNRNLIENKIINIIDIIIQMGNNVDLLKLLGFCYAKISLTASSISNKWREILSKLMNSLWEFSRQPEFSSIKKPTRIYSFDQCGTMKNFSFEMKESSPIEIYQKLYFISSAICTLITGQYSTKLLLPVEGMLECFTTLMIISINLGQEQLSSIILDNVYDLLRSLLICCGTNLLNYCPLINNIVNSTIKWLEGKNFPHSSDIRCSLYRFLSSYFKTLEVNTCLSNNQFNPILEMIIKDIKSWDSTIEIKKQYSTEFIEQNKEDKRNLTYLSIQCLNSILNHSSNLLQTSSYQIIHLEVITTLIYIYKNWFNLKKPYQNETCRKELLETLRLLVVDAQNSVDVPLEGISAVFEEAQRLENSQSIRQMVTNSLNLINFVLLSRIPLQGLELQASSNSLLKDNSLELSSQIMENKDVASTRRKLENESSINETKIKHVKKSDDKFQSDNELELVQNGNDLSMKSLEEDQIIVISDTEKEELMVIPNDSKASPNKVDQSSIDHSSDPINIDQPTDSINIDQPSDPINIDQPTDSINIDQPTDLINIDQHKDEEVENILKFFVAE